MTESSKHKIFSGNDEKPGASVEEVLAAELAEIELSREGRLNEKEIMELRREGNDSEQGSTLTGNDISEKECGVYGQAHRSNLIGVAFSGGGIRSATFNLGVLQGLAECGLLRFIDYLSTVSGGGYIGSWFVSWIMKNESVGDIESKLCASAQSSCTFEERKEVKFLRKYSNYLTPKKGFFGADMWAVISTYLRNLSLNLTVFIPFLIVILLFPAVAVWVFHLVSHNFARHPDNIICSTLIFLGIGVYFINLNLAYFSPAKQRISQDHETRPYPWYTKQGYILLVIVLPIMGSALLGSFSIWFIQRFDVTYKTIWLIKAIAAYLFSYFAGILTADIFHNFQKWEEEKAWGLNIRSVAVNTFNSTTSRISNIWSLSCQDKTVDIVSVFLSLLSGVGLAYCLNYIAARLTDTSAALWYVTGFGMPLVIIAYMAAVTIQIGFAGRDLPDEKREWWSRLGGWFFIFILLWTALFTIAIYGAPLLIWASEFVTLPLLAGWIATSVSGLLAGKGPNTGKAGSKSLRDLVAKAAPYIFILGLLLLFYFFVFLFCIHFSKTWEDFWEPLRAIKNFGWLVATNLFYARYLFRIELLLIFLVSLVAAILFSWRLDINQFSIHMLYRNRLIRCYLGASNQHRNPQPFTGFDSEDDFQLCQLRRDCGYNGPYPIINTALNLVSGKNIAWQQRKAASFILTPKYCGYDMSIEDGNHARSAYMPTYSYDGDNGMSVGEAMAISGAAASPNMGYHSSPPLTFLMTIFNLRLGWWCGNTLFEKAWEKASPNWGLRYLIKELFGLTDRESKYVYLSDGGHFENLGLYELVRRRCRTIIVSDAGCDPETKYEDIGNAIRKIRVDLGIPIDIDLSLINTKKAHCVTGIIKYTSVDKCKGVEDGTLIYIKPLICGKEPADVANYSLTHEDFPHQTTAEQWFDESQFESYRMLGLHSIQTICGGKWKGTNPHDFSDQVEHYLHIIRKEIAEQEKKSPEKPSVKTGPGSTPVEP